MLCATLATTTLLHATLLILSCQRTCCQDTAWQNCSSTIVTDNAVSSVQAGLRLDASESHDCGRHTQLYLAALLLSATLPNASRKWKPALFLMRWSRHLSACSAGHARSMRSSCWLNAPQDRCVTALPCLRLASRPRLFCMSMASFCQYFCQYF